MGLFLILSATALAVITAWMLWRQTRTPPGSPEPANGKGKRWAIAATVVAVLFLVAVLELVLTGYIPILTAPDVGAPVYPHPLTATDPCGEDA